MKSSEIRELSDEELQVEIKRAHQALFDIRSQSATEKLEDPSMITKAKRDIARMLTIATERRRAAETASAGQ